MPKAFDELTVKLVSHRSSWFLKHYAGIDPADPSSISRVKSLSAVVLMSLKMAPAVDRHLTERMDHGRMARKDSRSPSYRNGPSAES